MAWAGYWHSAATLNFLRGYAANGDHTPVQSIEATGLEHGPAGKAKHGIRDIRRLGEVKQQHVKNMFGHWRWLSVLGASSLEVRNRFCVVSIHTSPRRDMRNTMFVHLSCELLLLM